MTPLSVRVLIVDHIRDSRAMVYSALCDQGFECGLAEDGIEAQQQLANFHYDAVITELLLPRMNGGELVVSLCARLRRPIVIVHTALREPEVARGLQREGVDEIIYKPADYREMAKAIRDLVAGRRSRNAWYDQFLRAKRPSTPEAAYSPRGLFTKGDHWIQGDGNRKEVFRFGIMILACILFGMGWGNELSPEVADLCRLFGLTGLAFYFCLQLVAYYRNQSHENLVKHSAERRLSLARGMNSKSSNDFIDDVSDRRLTESA